MAAIASQDADLKQQPANLNTSPKSTVSTNPITEEKIIPSSNGKGLHVEYAKQLEYFKTILASNEVPPETKALAQKAMNEITEMIAEHNKNMAELEVWASEQRMPAEAIKEITEMIAKGGGKANSRGLILLEKYKYTAALYYLSNNSLYQDYGFPESELKVLANEIKQFEKFEEKAKRNGLPQVLVFSKASSTSALLKFVSAEYRRRLLIGEIKQTKKNLDLFKKYNIKTAPAIIVIKENGDVVNYDKGKMTMNRVVNFLGDHALKTAVVPKKKVFTEEELEEKAKKKEKKKEEKTKKKAAKAKKAEARAKKKAAEEDVKNRTPADELDDDEL